ncbi:hypothetical protein amrb99_36540 [Actinomadura sp. RB99]|uniref:hypothetical protein n=1 Tax=Actinomadura sp. RB99 TaxID=2691577 RepID=UPI001688AECF|nr:hypothetical protein [Actinomadura sp. RB99]MBD2894727.1 hypothetical protein [Actinomadura sp. RB99]
MYPSSPVHDLAVEVEQVRRQARRPRAHVARMERLRTAKGLLGQVITAQGQKSDPAALGAFAADWIELCPITSAELAGVTPSEDEAAELTLLWSELYARYLGLMVKYPPSTQRPRILRGIRRCAVTVGPDALGVVRVRALTDTDEFQSRPLNSLRRRAVHALTEGGSTQGKLFKATLPALEPRSDPVETLAVSGYTAVLDFVPEDEQREVLNDMLRLCYAAFDDDPTWSPTGWTWQATVACAGGSVHYEISVDGDRVVRAERLGAGTDRNPAQFVSARGADAMKAELITAYGLTGIEGQGGAEWRPVEIALTAGALSRLPAHGRGQLAGTALIRGAVPPRPVGASLLHVGAYHAGLNRTYDPVQERPLPDPPHLHVYQPIFDHQGLSCCGAPGDAGPVCEFEVLHEMGHAIGQRPPHLARKSWEAGRAAAYRDASALARKLKDVYTSKLSYRRPLRPWTEAIQVYPSGEQAYARAVELLCVALETCDAGAIVTAKQGLATAQTAMRQTRDGLMTAATAVTGCDALPECAQAGTLTEALTNALTGPVPDILRKSRLARDFGDMARRFGFTPITRYAERSDAELIAETYALFCTDPHRLWEWNWRVCRWFEDHCPDPTGYDPVAFP